ncbi:MAG: hypothetical protein KF730_12000 [Sphingomonas sp.]|uniref:hypothetical protein n=1 Tax=Sphingomonas sp. TaxID=28214 RepID=UPI0025EF3620|nr:hypothetical protein [Sphingomonas sp.]MBX3565283.1 hypothetical protein [Sphingomonas sp.]
MAGLAGVQARVAALAKAQPEAALALSANNADALVAAVDQQIMRGKSDIDLTAMAVSASRALRAAPLNPGALRQLGLAKAGKGDQAGGRALVMLGNRVSQRDFLAHVWMIEDRVAENDIPGALDHYDLALSISELADGALFPVLSGALSEPEVRAAFAPYLHKLRPWMPRFLTYVVNSGSGSVEIADALVVRGGGGLPATPSYAGLDAQLLKKLIANGNYDTAYRYAASLPAGAQAMREIGFTEAATNLRLGPVVWELADSADLRVRPSSGDKLDVTVRSNADGVAATRILFLKPGSYRFSHAVAPLPDTDPVSLTWVLRCLPAGQDETIWKQDYASTLSEKQFAVVVKIPDRCRAQQLGVVIRGGDTQNEAGVVLGPLAMVAAPVR